MGTELILGRLVEGRDWIRLVQNRDRWRAVMNAVMSPKERDHSKDQCVDGRMGPEWILGRLDEGEDWIRPVQ
jgi:hypothetical protein